MYFNPFKEAIVDSSNLSVSLENGHILDGKEEIVASPEVNQSQPSEKDDQWEVDWRKPDAHRNDHKFVNRSYRHSGFPSEIVSRQQSTWTIVHRIRSRPNIAGKHTRGNAPVASQPRSTIRPPAFMCWSPSDVLIPLAKLGCVQTSRKSPTGKTPIIVAEQDSGSEISSIDQDVPQALVIRYVLSMVHIDHRSINHFLMLL